MIQVTEEATVDVAGDVGMVEAVAAMVAVGMSLAAEVGEEGDSRLRFR